MSDSDTLAEVRLRFDYDPDTGVFTHRHKPQSLYGSERAWKIAQTKTVGTRADSAYCGYRGIQLIRRSLFAHRVAWLLTYERWPEFEIDHINGDPCDNRIANLRDVVPSLNRMNQRQRSDNSSGVTGVSFNRNSGKWVAQICASGVRQRLGVFRKFEDAVVARLAAQSALPFGPNHGAKP